MRVPKLVKLAAAPLIGGLFLLALPLVGFGALAAALGRKLGIGARSEIGEDREGS